MKHANVNQELAEVLNLKPLQGLTVPQALEAARAEYSIRLRHFQMRAVDRRNERAYCQARAAFEVIEHVVAVLESAMTPEPAPVAAKVERARCPHHKQIRTFFSFARGAMLDTRDEDAMRDALSRFVGRELETRADLSGSEWACAADAVKRGKLVW